GKKRPHSPIAEYFVTPEERKSQIRHRILLIRLQGFCPLRLVGPEMVECGCILLRILFPRQNATGRADLLSHRTERA
ncbi:MAG TPA: hypothetical protein VGE83_06820, partial [Terracidiphilus sp.]